MIAEANDIDDPTRLAPGTELLLPAPDEFPAEPARGHEPTAGATALPWRR